VGLTAASATFSNFKLRHDNSADGDIGDARDDLTVSDTFGSTSVTMNADNSDATDDAWDRAGDMVLDTRFRFVYDAWNRLVKAQSRQDSDLLLQTAECDGLGRRIQKAVSNSGDLDRTFTFYYDSGWRLLEVRDGSANVVAQVYGGTQAIRTASVSDRPPIGTASVSDRPPIRTASVSDRHPIRTASVSDRPPIGTASVSDRLLSEPRA